MMASLPFVRAGRFYNLGDRVLVRDAESEEWKRGTVQQIVDGYVRVKPDDWKKHFFGNNAYRVTSASAVGLVSKPMKTP